MTDKTRNMSAVRKTVLALAIGAMTSAASAADAGFADVQSAKAWMKGKVGVFCHFLPDATTYPRLNEFDVDGLVADLKRMKPDYFMITLGQNTGYYCAPNPVLEEIAGYAENTRCSARDIPGEIIAGLKGSGIRFGLYLPNQPAASDAKMEDAFGFSSQSNSAGGDADRLFTSTGSDNWAKVIGYWSKRYGDAVSLWWFDGGYSWLNFSDEHAAKYKAAVRAGNATALVSFNAGVGFASTESMSDFWAGEENSCLAVLPREGGVNAAGVQWQVLSYLGSTWGQSDCRFSDDQLKGWLAEATRLGGAVTLDVHIDCPGGRIPEAQVAQFVRVRPGAETAKSETVQPKSGAKASAAGASAVLGGCVSALAERGEPELKVGIISDVHVPVAGIERMAAAFALFDRRKVDAVLVCGDLTNYGLVRELEKFRDTWRMSFPGSRRSDGAAIVPLFIYGDHDTGGYMHKFDDGLPPRWLYGLDRAALERELIVNVGAGKAWRQVFGEEWDFVQVKDVKGYRFILSHYYGTIHQQPPPDLAKHFAAATEGADGKRPFFFVQHRVYPGTVDAFPWEREWWCADCDASNKLLSNHPNAVALCGHAHSNLLNEGNFWRGAFTAVEVPSLQQLGLPRSSGIRSAFDETSAQCLVMNVWPHHVTFERLEARQERKLAEDWSVEI